VRTDRLQKEYGVEVKWTVFPLHPDTPEEGLELSELFAGREADIEAMQTRLAAIARVEGLPLANVPEPTIADVPRSGKMGRITGCGHGISPGGLMVPILWMAGTLL